MKEVRRKTIYIRCIKRIIDVIIALSGIIVLFVPMAIVAVLIMKDSSGSVLFTQIRSGKNRKPFKILKFRTLPPDSPHYIASNNMTDKIRLTPLQKYLRKSSIDELPQLYNVLKGDMSIVGPRPVICEETDLLCEREKYGANDVLPGLTGWAQINGRDELDIHQKARLDGEYVSKISFAFDLKCFILSINYVLTHNGFKDKFD